MCACSNSLRVTHPDVVIGLLCLDAARTFGVPPGLGSLCLHVLLHKQVMRKQLKSCKKKNNEWLARVHKEPFPLLMY